MMKKKVSYKSSGVDIDKGNKFVDAIGRDVKSTFSSSVLQRKGAFGGLFALNQKGMKKPVLVSSTDGVGTKLLVALAVGKHDTVGIDLVAMNVNDILCVGAKPLFFLDYIACGKLDTKILKSVVAGIAKGCKLSGCSLIGGETAEMPDMYKKQDYDLAGFALGVVDEKKIIDGSKIKAGDCLIGLASSGIHSNGYSLVRKVFSVAEQKKRAKELLAPTKIYAKEVEAVLKKYKVNGIAHITGGAYYEKLTKLLPKGKCFSVDKNSWPVPAVFKDMQKLGNITEKEMYRTFNMGIGLVMVVGKKDVSAVMKTLKSIKAKAYMIGEVINHPKKRILL
ncbi:phosphoribosylformylglycinamidine cyclo-ligase [Candidatus Omnitrophota bacterium]